MRLRWWVWADFGEVMEVAQMGGALASDLLADLVETGARHVNELNLADWQFLPA